MPNGSGVGPRDNNLILRASSEGDLEVTETGTFTVDPRMYKAGLSLYVNLPATPTGSSPTLKVKVEGEDDHGEVEVTHTDNLTATASAEGDEAYPSTLLIPIPWTLSNDYKYTLTVGGSSPNFSTVEVWVARAAESRVP